MAGEPPREANELRRLGRVNTGSESEDPAARGGSARLELLTLLDGLTILYLEDDPDTREVTTEGLGRYGARVFACDTAQMGLLLFEQHHPDVIIADLKLADPELDGWRFIQAVRDLPSEREKRTPAIAVTAHNEPADRLKSLSAGYTLHMAKPVGPAQLAQRIRLLIRRDVHK